MREGLGGIGDQIGHDLKDFVFLCAMSGVCSRRDADILISDGKININGKVIREMGYQVNRKDVVSYQGKNLITQKFVYVLLL